MSNLTTRVTIVIDVSWYSNNMFCLVTVAKVNVICDWACKNRACGHMIFVYFSNFYHSYFLYHYVMAMQFSALSKHLISIMMHVTKYKYSVPVLRCDL